MPELTVDTVTRIAEQTARDLDPDLNVTGVVLNASGGDYVEVVLSIRNCDRAPCQLSVGAFRDDGEDKLRRELAKKIETYLSARGSRAT